MASSNSRRIGACSHGAPRFPHNRRDGKVRRGKPVPWTLPLAERDRRLLSDPWKPGDDRTGDEAQRDRDRVLYSSAFRRLAEVTQVVSPSGSQVFHNRLTHTLKVAQIGRALAESLRDNGPPELVHAVGDINPTVVEAASLAHDLGHPPFGHLAEH